MMTKKMKARKHPWLGHGKIVGHFSDGRGAWGRDRQERTPGAFGGVGTFSVLTVVVDTLV